MCAVTVLDAQLGLAGDRRLSRLPYVRSVHAVQRDHRRGRLRLDPAADRRLGPCRVQTLPGTEDTTRVQSTRMNTRTDTDDCITS